MLVSARKCHTCKDILYSRAGHDYRQCGCGKIAVDGGYTPGYQRLIGDMDNSSHVEVEVDATKDEIFQDWNCNTGLYGVIKDADK